MSDLIKEIKKSFQDKEYRHSYIDDFLNVSIATQIKVLREQREWNQKDLAKYAGMLQPRISVLENINYSSWSIKVLRKIAEAFDLTLRVSFESFGNRIRDIEKFSRNTLEKNSFDEDPYFKEQAETDLDNKYKTLKAPKQKAILINYKSTPKNKREEVRSKGIYDPSLDTKQHVAYGGL